MGVRETIPTSFAKRPPRVLVVDDDEQIRRMLERLLARLGCLVVTVGTAADARAACASSRFALAIVDLTLPDARGDDLVAELRALLGERAPPFAIFSGNAPPRELPAGVVAYLTKPLGIEELLAAVKSALAPGRAPPGTARASGSHPISSQPKDEPKENIATRPPRVRRPSVTKTSITRARPQGDDVEKATPDSLRPRRRGR